MGFKFQINQDTKFKRNEPYLSIAKKNDPVIYYSEHEPQKYIDGEKYTQNINEDTVNSETDLLNKKFTRDDSVILDFGNHYVGRFLIDIKKIGAPMDAPLTLKIQFAENYDELSYKPEEYDGWLSKSWIPIEVLHIDSLPSRLKMSRRYSFRYAKITVIDTSPKWKIQFENPLVISQSAISEKDYSDALIHNDDPMLEKIENVSIKTLSECMQSVFEDGTKRDQRLWLGDLHLQALANYSTFNKNNLVKKCLYLFAGLTTSDGKICANIFTNKEVIPDDTFLFDHSLFFVSTLKDYFERTSDAYTAGELYNTSKRQVDLALNLVDQYGKLSLPSDWPAFIDWNDDFNKETAAQAVLVYVLKDFISLSKELEMDISDDYEYMLRLLINYSQRKLFNESNNQFISGKNNEINIYSQIWMILANVFDKEKSKSIMESTIKDFFPIKNIATPYMYHFVAETLLSVGMKEEAISLIKGYWGSMIEKGADTFWEAYKPDDPSYSPYGSPLVNSYCHAWSCTPVYLIKKYNL